MPIVADCPVTRFPDSLPALHLNTEDDAVTWLSTQSKRQRVKKKFKVQQTALCFGLGRSNSVDYADQTDTP